MLLYVMGVSGSGKSTIGKLLADRLGVAFYDGDDFHSPENKAKMAAGHPLDDADREPWLTTLNLLARRIEERGENAIIVCSALKQMYRDQLSACLRPENVRFIMLEGSQDLIASRLSLRKHEFMNPTLLKTQFDALESPSDAIHISNDRPPNGVVEEIVTRLSASGFIF